MSEHDAFRQSGSAARIRKRHQIFARIDCDFRKVAVVIQQRREGSGVVCFTFHVIKNKQLFDAGFVRRGGGFLETLRHGDQETRARVFQLMRDFVFGVERINRTDDAAERGDAVKGDRIFRNVWTENAEDLAFFESAFRQAGRRARDANRQVLNR